MDTKKVVFNKLFSKEAQKAQKLSKQRKVSLSLVDDMQSYLSSMQDEVADGIAASDSAYEFAQELESKIESLNDNLSYLEGYLKAYSTYNSEASDLLAKYRSAAEDLGINPDDNDTYIQLEDVLKEMNDAYGQVEFSINALKQIIK